MQLRILAMDPGTANFAVSIMRISYVDGVFRFKCEGSAMLDGQRLLKDMKTMRTSLKVFEDYVQPLFDQDYDAFVAERFQARGGKGPTIESVNCMLGRMAGMSAHIEHGDFITAGVWKNEFNRFGDLKEMYADHKELRRDKTRPHIQIHQLDACLLGIYIACKIIGIRPFSFLTSRAKEAKLLSSLDGAPELKCLQAPLPKVRKVKRKSKAKAKKCAGS